MLYEVITAQVGLLRHHVCQQRVGGDIERHTQENVCASLIELAGESAVGNIELEQGVTGRERHCRYFADVPCAYDDPPRVGILPDPADGISYNFV